eukprot:gene2294-2467_t
MFGIVAESVSSFYSWVTAKKEKRLKSPKYKYTPKQKPMSVMKPSKTKQNNFIGTEIKISSNIPTKRDIGDDFRIKGSFSSKKKPIALNFEDEIFFQDNMHKTKKRESNDFMNTKYLSRPNYNQKSDEDDEEMDLLNQKLKESCTIDILRERTKMYTLIHGTSDEFNFQVSCEVLEDILQEITNEIIEKEICEDIFSIIYDEILKDIFLEEKEFKEISENEEDIINSILYKKNRKEIIVSGFNVDLTCDDVSCLKNGNWLNDEVINFIMNLIMERSKKSKILPKVHCFNTFFYAKLTQRGEYKYDNVKRWTRKIDLFSLDKIIIPIHLGVHWTLAVINIRDKRFEYYDSLDGCHKYILNDLKKYLKDEHLDKKKKEIDLSNWKYYIPSRKEIPQQLNGFDCGMFCCTFANFTSQDYDFQFSQKNMKYLRNRTLLNIISKNLK